MPELPVNIMYYNDNGFILFRFNKKAAKIQYQDEIVEARGAFKMNTWEYCKVIGSTAEGKDGFLCYYKSSKPQIFPLKAEAWELAIARLGQEGWELVAVENNTFFFKRPKAK